VGSSSPQDALKAVERCQAGWSEGHGAPGSPVPRRRRRGGRWHRTVVDIPDATAEEGPSGW